MPNENEVQGGQDQTTQPTVDATAQPQTTASAGDDTPAGVRQMADGRVQMLTSSAFRELKEKTAAKARKARDAELDKEAQELGYQSYADMKASAALRNRPAGQQAPKKPQQQRQAASELDEPGDAPQPEPRAPLPPQGGRNDHKAWSRYERERKQFEQRLANYRARLHVESQRRRVAQDELNRHQVRSELEKTAMRAGVVEIDYAVTLLEREIQGKGPKELESFDEAKFFESLREKKPYLFGENVVPATTGTAGGNAPAAPNPGQVTQQQAQNGHVDVMKMTKAEYHEHLRKMGLSVPSL